MWNWRAKNARKRTIKATESERVIEHLETRALLAGNVVASLNGSHLTVTGDAADNAIDITILNGQIQLRGLSSTTINGATTPFVIAAGTDTLSGNVLIQMAGGNDAVSFTRGINFNGVVDVHGQAGNDSIAANGVTFKSQAYFWGYEGNDTFSVQDTTVDGSLVIHGNQDNDLITLKTVTLNGSTEIKGQDGDDGVSLNDVTSNSDLAIKTGFGDDDVTINNSRINSSLLIKTKQGSDAVMLDDNTFGGRAHINLGRDNDGVMVRNTNTFNGAFSVQGGDSRQNSASDFPSGDAVSIDSANVFNQGRRLRKTEATTVSTAANDRFDADNTGLIDRATAADTAGKNQGGISISATAAAADAAKALTSDGVLITKDGNLTVTGTTLAGATVTVDADNDGQFDDGTVTADATGAYSVPVVVTRKDLYTGDATANDQLTGLQDIKVRATLNTETADSTVKVDLIKDSNSLVKFTSQVNANTTQEYFIEMFNAEAPITVTNFLAYINAGRYENSIIHRSVATGSGANATPFVIQGGGFTVEDGLVNVVPKFNTITSEFNAARGNQTGTISMAHPSNTNLGSSEWFINLNNNTDLNTDSVDKRHTVFGRVVGNGMTVVNAIHALTETNLVDETGLTALTDVPYRKTFVDFERTLSGTIQTTANSTSVVGVGTKFTTELKGNVVAANGRSRIQINGQTFFVASIDDDTHLTLTQAPTTAGTGVTAKTDFNNDNDFVRFSTIAEVLGN
ncbi:MAG: peptidylprolyl isomerase [Planctomycetales bacterium]|nr:peptidylprolyl isomerase [Planctomycetales bacterium]